MGGRQGGWKRVRDKGIKEKTGMGGQKEREREEGEGRLKCERRS